jgi:hypothetical protein
MGRRLRKKPLLQPGQASWDSRLCASCRGIAQHSTHSTAQHSTAQHSTA